MPLKRWTHPCCDREKGTLHTTPACLQCGASGEYASWHWTMHEAMARYQTWYGLKPVGPHRRFTDELFAARTSGCAVCDGSGLEDVDQGSAYRLCCVCGGTGKRFEGTDEDFEQLRQEVVSLYPESFARSVPRSAKMLAFDVGAQEIVDLGDAPASAPDAGSADDSAAKRPDPDFRLEGDTGRPRGERK
jgi:hypothetical protein